jgi:ribosome-binding factor A
MSRRSERVADLIRAEISSLIQRELHDPGFGFVTITGVSVSDDLKSARVFFSCLGDDVQFTRTQEAFDRAAGFLRREVAHRCRLRFAPELHFRPDHSAETGARIERILKESLRSEDESGPGS